METNHVVRTSETASSGPQRTTALKKIKTLIVDDEPLARERLASLLGAEADIEVVGAGARRRGGGDRDPGPPAAAGVPRRPDAAHERLRRHRRRRPRAHAARHLRHRLRPARPQGVPGPGPRLHPQAVRPRAVRRRAAARAAPDRARRDRRPRPAAARARQGPAPRPAQDRSPGRQVGRAAVLPADGRDRLDRGGRQLRAAPRRARRRTCCARR